MSIELVEGLRWRKCLSRKGMKRFAKINGPKPQTLAEISVLPAAARIWGERFIFERIQREISWICNQSGILGFVESGQMAIRSEAGSLVISPGNFVFIPPQCPYLEQKMGIRTTGWYISIPPLRCKRFPKQVALLRSSDLLLALGVRIVSLSPQSKKLKCNKNLIAVFLDEMAIAQINDRLVVPLPFTENLRRVAEEIVERPADMKNIDSWARKAGMSRRSFTRQFASEVGISFSKWRRRVKLSSALHSYRDGKTIDEISFDLGYQNPSTFIALFKKQFGMSPARYLKKILGE